MIEERKFSIPYINQNKCSENKDKRFGNNNFSKFNSIIDREKPLNKIKYINPSSPKSLNKNPYVIKHYMEKVNDIYRQDNKIDLNGYKRGNDFSPNQLEKSYVISETANNNIDANFLKKYPSGSPIPENKFVTLVRNQNFDVSMIKETVAKYLNGKNNNNPKHI